MWNLKPLWMTLEELIEGIERSHERNITKMIRKIQILWNIIEPLSLVYNLPPFTRKHFCHDNLIHFPKGTTVAIVAFQILPLSK